ncbi:MAG: lysophospholipid acyltransferase family protein [Pseudomonadota bacterium]
MIALRCVLFAIAFYGWVLIVGTVYFPLLLLPRAICARLAHFWVRSSLWLVRVFIGIRCEVRGRENLPPEPFVIASKHQSAWDTLVYADLFYDSAYVLKKELMLLPFFGWYLFRLQMIGIDRSGGAKALSALVRDVKDRLANGRSIIIFPQGTRTAPGVERKYLPGVSAIYRQADTAIVPVALNSGMFWPRRRFIKFSGTIILEFLPPIEPGLDRRSFERTLRERIEPATHRLEAEAARELGIAEPSAQPIESA